MAHVITGLSDGGAESVLFRLCTRDASEIEHIVISLTTKGKYGDVLEAEGIVVHALNLPRGFLALGGLFRLVALLRNVRPDVLQTWMYHADFLGGLAGRTARMRNVFWNVRHSEIRPGATGRSTRLVAWACARLSRVVPRKIIACAERARDVHMGIGYDSSKFVVIPNGYDVNAFSADAGSRNRIRQSLGVAAEEPLLGLVGRWNPQKDHGNMLSAFAQLRGNWPDARLALVGTGCDADNAELRAQTSGLGLVERVLLLGRRDDIPAVMNAFDFLVLSSSHGEAFPNVVAEAMACGTPCVVTDVGDAAMIVGDTGWVVPPGDAAALAEAIATALAEREKPDVWSQRQRAARQRIVDRFSLEAMVERYREAWASASQRGTSPTCHNHNPTS